MHLQIILGSIRQGRIAKPVGDWTYEFTKKAAACTVELIDLKEWNLPMFDLPKSPIMGDYQDENQKKWARKVAEGDAYLFISPEYNHGYSPALKNALDYLYAEWNRKPATFVAYGGVEGARSVEQLRGVLVELQIAPLREALHIRNVFKKVQNEQFQPEEFDEKQLATVLDELLWWGKALKRARASQ